MTVEMAVGVNMIIVASSDAVIGEILRRRDIPKGQRDLFRALDEGGNSGLGSEELAQRMGGTLIELRGVLGAFGKRINATPGIRETQGRKPGIRLVLRVERKSGQNRYWLKPEFQTILKDKGPV
jgi:hypothetical protein